MIRILLVDDHVMVRQAFKVFLANEPDLDVVAEARDGETALWLAQSLSPDIVIMDIELPGANGIEITRRMLAENKKIKVIALSFHADQQILRQMLNAGACGYIVKTAASIELLRGIRAVIDGHRFLCPEATALAIDSLPRQNLAESATTRTTLTRREKQIVTLLSEGRTAPEIGRLLHISSATVEVHRRNIMRKLQINNVAGLTRYAIREGLISA